MAYPIGTGSLIEVRVTTEVAGQSCLNVLHYTVRAGAAPITNGPAYLDAINVLALNDDGLWPLVLRMTGRMADPAVIRSVASQAVFPTRYRAVTRTSDRPGVAEEPAMPPNVALTITKATDSGARGSTGAFHLAGAPLSAATAGRWSLGYIGGTATLASLLFASFTPVDGLGTLDPVLWRRTPPGGTRPVVTTIIQPTVRVMRRRTVGVGQ